MKGLHFNDFYELETTSWRSIYDSIMSVYDSASISKWTGTVDVINDSFIAIMNRWNTRRAVIQLKLSEACRQNHNNKSFYWTKSLERNRQY